jgi:hypothetical protein
MKSILPRAREAGAQNGWRKQTMNDRSEELASYRMIQVFHLIVNGQHRWYCALKKEQAVAHGFTRWDRLERRWYTTNPNVMECLRMTDI